ncbi:sigma-70 family RNA polymerase sigma factor [Roseomonas genomospecies 6]|uniref:Uncharacterized protein n=1 Tax=Roseomonas genomospecies 6 TaxID=214106 RepID=A0A9W7NG29_9PROT|nr:sigma-70 family RNA polymerase sigma factor [Roseomonas genomospecies 6]KAA0677617.1 hypothetical protein DS843_22520 [Roseomonas genomospecies 6]
MDHSLSAFIAAQKFLTAAEERDLITRAQAGSKRARDRLVESHLPLVAANAARVARWSGLDDEELLSIGSEEVVKAVDRFDLSRKARLSTAAGQSVNRAMVEYVLKNRSMIFHGGRKGRAAQRMLTKYSHERLECDLDAVIAEIAEALELDGVDQLALYRSRSRDISLDATVGEDGDTTVGELMSNGEGEDDVIEMVENNRRLSLLDRALASLSEVEREIFKGRTLTEPAISMKALSDRFHISADMVREITNVAQHKVTAFVLSGGKVAPQIEAVVKPVETVAEEAVVVETTVVAAETVEVITPVAEATLATHETSAALRRLALADELSFGPARAMVTQHLATVSGRRAPAPPSTPILVVPRQVGSGVAREVVQHLTPSNTVVQRHISYDKKSEAASTTELVVGATASYSPRIDGKEPYGDGGKPYDKVSYRQTDGEAPRVEPGAASRPAQVAEKTSALCFPSASTFRPPESGRPGVAPVGQRPAAHPLGHLLQVRPGGHLPPVVLDGRPPAVHLGGAATRSPTRLRTTVVSDSVPLGAAGGGFNGGAATRTPEVLPFVRPDGSALGQPLATTSGQPRGIVPRQPQAKAKGAPTQLGLAGGGGSRPPTALQATVRASLGLSRSPQGLRLAA